MPLTRHSYGGGGNPVQTACQPSRRGQARGLGAETGCGGAWAVLLGIAYGLRTAERRGRFWRWAGAKDCVSCGQNEARTAAGFEYRITVGRRRLLLVPLLGRLPAHGGR